MDTIKNHSSSAAVITSSPKRIRLAAFNAHEMFSDLRQLLDQLTGPGWVLHQIDPEISAASLVKGDRAPRNYHAENLIRHLGVPIMPMLYGTVTLMGKAVDHHRPVWRQLTGLDTFHHELITDEHHRLLASI